jgi:hypothetical protein
MISELIQNDVVLIKKMKGMKFKTSMLEYCKLILTKISFNKFLFLKEYRKSRKILSRSEARELRQWVRARFKFDQRSQQMILYQPVDPAGSR